MSRLFALIFILITAQTSWAGCPVEYLEDPLSELTAQTAIVADGYEPLTKDKNTFGFSGSTFWLRVDCSNWSEKSGIATFDYPLLDEIDVYSAETLRLIYQIGDLRPLSNRALKSRKFAFPVETNNKYLLRVWTSSSMQLPIHFSNESAFISETTQESLALGLYYGIILALALYNLLLLIKLRDRVYFYYVCYLLTYGLFQASLNGMGSLYIWNFNVWWSNQALPFFIWVSFGFIFLFTHRFLGSALPQLLKRVLIWSAGVSGVTAIATLFLPYSAVIYAAAVFCFFLAGSLIFAGTVALRNDFKPARYFLGAWISFLLGIVVLQFKNFGIAESNFFTNYAIQIGSALEVILLSLALGEKYKRAIDERNEAEMKLLKISEDIKLIEADKERAEKFHNRLKKIAHDLRTPIGVLGQFITSVSFKKFADADRNTIEKTVANINGIVSNINSSENEESDSDVLDKKPFLLPRAISEIVEQMRFKSRDLKGVQIDFDFSLNPKGHFVNTDEIKFKRVMMNLIDNSIESLNEAGRVEITIVERKGAFDIIITDNGCGMSPEQLEELGGEGVTFKTNGNGLGVCQAKDFASQSDGDLQFRSNLGKGTTTTLTLPKTETPAWYVHQLDLSNKKFVFIVDDDPIMKDAWNLKIGAHPKFKGQVVRFKSPEEFSKLAGAYRSQIDQSLILMDFHFANSKKTGVDAIKEHSLQKRAVLVSGHTSLPEILDECVENEINFLPKQLISQVEVIV